MKSSVKNKVNFGIVKRIYKGLKHWCSKIKLFFIRSVAHSKNPPLLDLSKKEKSEVFDEFKLHSKYFKLFINSSHFTIMFKQFIVSEYFLFKNEIIQILKVDEKYYRGDYENIEQYQSDLEKAKKSYNDEVKNFLENHPKKTGTINTICDKSDVINNQYFKSGIVKNQKINPEFQKAIDNIFISVDELTKLDKILTQIKDNKHLFKKHGFTLTFSDGEETQHLI